MVGEVRVPPVKIVVCNNNGGSMFKFVPIGKYSEEVAYDKNFRTPIEVAFAGAAEMMGLKGSTKVEGLSKMVECLGHSGLIEIVSIRLGRLLFNGDVRYPRLVKMRTWHSVGGLQEWWERLLKMHFGCILGSN